mmetsp:Transcript_21582/g.40309  ORF Transcript_21582/g.40309 Transcript_21582/m.40309 type:complete len:123 (-) Transcript_21582:123-491(-)
MLTFRVPKPLKFCITLTNASALFLKTKNSVSARRSTVMELHLTKDNLGRTLAFVAIPVSKSWINSWKCRNLTILRCCKALEGTMRFVQSCFGADVQHSESGRTRKLFFFFFENQHTTKVNES